MSENPLTTEVGQKPKGPGKKLFQPGNQAAKGRKNPLFRLRQVVRTATKASDVRAVFLQLAKKAKGGDMQACKLFLSYAIGEPNQTIEVTHHDGVVDIPAAIQMILSARVELEAELQLDVEYLGQ